MRTTIVLMTSALSLLPAAMSFAADADSDHDGVSDRYDLCSNTPAGSPVWRQGEWIGCTSGQQRDRDVVAPPPEDHRAQIIDAINSCEDSLSARLRYREVYAGSTCEPYAHQLENVMQPYFDFGRADLGSTVASMTTEHLSDRMRLCLSSDRGMASTFDAMDSSGCSPYAPADGWSGETSRVPATTGSSGSSNNGPYSRGVTYTHSGNVTFGSDGRTYTTSGNVTFGSDGSTYISSGNVTFGSDGNTYITSGNVTFGSNGTTCISSGNTTFCH